MEKVSTFLSAVGLVVVLVYLPGIARRCGKYGFIETFKYIYKK